MPYAKKKRGASEKRVTPLIKKPSNFYLFLCRKGKDIQSDRKDLQIQRRALAMQALSFGYYPNLQLREVSHGR